MAFVNPNILQKIMGGAQQFGQTLGSAPQSQQEQLWQMLAGAGAGMSQAAAQPGASFGQALGGGAQGMMAGQQNAQQAQMNQLKMQQAQAEMARQERISKIMGDILQPRRPDFASQVDARLPAVPQIGQAQASPYTGGPGAMTARYESGNNPAAVSTGRGDPGGVSYGASQLSSNAGTMGNFLQSQEGQPFAAQFQGLDPGSEQFSQRFQQVASQSPEFAQAQQQYLQRTHVQPVMAAASQAGMPVDNPAIQAALHSQATQHSGDGNVQIINETMARIGPNSSPEEILDTLYNVRERYATGALQRNGASEDVIQGVQNRYRQERQETLGMLGDRQVGGMQNADASMQNAGAQPQMNGYQQRALQAQADDPLAGLPSGTRRFLALMDPEDALKTVVDLQTAGPDLPADVRSALFIAGGDENLARQIMAANMSEQDMPVFMQQIEAIKAANPDITHQAAVNHILDVTTSSVSPNTGRVTRTDNLRAQATEVPVQPGEPLPEPQATGPSGWDLVERANVTGVGSGLAEFGNRTLNQLGFNVGEDTVTARQYMRQIEMDIARAFQESPRFAEGERQQILQELNLGPDLLRDESTLRAGLRASASSLQARLDRYSRMAADTRLGETTRRDAAEKAAVIGAALQRLGVPEEARYSRGEIVPEQRLDIRGITDEDRQRLQRYLD